MKLKCRPEDFVVTELSEYPIRARGEWTVYELTKRGIGTPEAITQLLQVWKIPRDRVSYGGLKDRHAVTTQFVSVERGPARNASRPLWDLRYLGQSDEAFRPADITGNRFRIVMRDMSLDECQRATVALEEVRDAGLPNYFDDQRFGSVTAEGEFIGRAWIAGDFERALWLALAAPAPHERANEKREKAILRKQWGHWTECLNALGRSHRRSIVAYLKDHPQDFRGAFCRVRQDLRSLYLSAFQSHLWNQVLTAVIEAACPEVERAMVSLALGPAPFFRRWDATETLDPATLMVPLPASRTDYLDHEAMQLVTEQVLARHGLTLSDIKIKYPRDSFFSKGERAAIVRPRELQFRVEGDTLYAGKHTVAMELTLPRGAYATILVKRITQAAAGVSLSLDGEESVGD
ncbi:MAG: tRNA pseudouridine(13) synthase TruD [Planctomycetota bacterium]|nr:MAG: tRNA pseudouridine(13) synthase TruD [Planctomycetota bacterium]